MPEMPVLCVEHLASTLNKIAPHGSAATTQDTRGDLPILQLWLTGGSTRTNLCLIAKFKARQSTRLKVVKRPHRDGRNTGIVVQGEPLIALQRNHEDTHCQ